MEKIKVEPRSFNFMELDERRGILTKRSTHKDKLQAEIRWYLKLPKELRYLAPRIFDYSLSHDSPFVSMEFYGYRTLHEMLISLNFSATSVRRRGVPIPKAEMRQRPRLESRQSHVRRKTCAAA